VREALCKSKINWERKRTLSKGCEGWGGRVFAVS